ncbi:MAG: hypothetical protein ACOY71_12450 [Gemmatimonadota bacterium]
MRTDIRHEPEEIMLAWETSLEPIELRRRFDDDEDFEDDGFSFDDEEDEDEDFDDEDLDDEEDDLEDEDFEDEEFEFTDEDEE